MRVRDLRRAAAGVGGVAVVTAVYLFWLNVTNTTTVALSFLLIVFVVAATSRLWVAVATSVAAMVCFNFFFLPPVGTLTIADPQNWVALFAFLAVSLVASNLSSVARTRTQEALAARDEVGRLFDLSRDVLIMTDSQEAITLLARLIARRFDLEYVAICLPDASLSGWSISEAGMLMLTMDSAELSAAIIDADARRTATADGHKVELIPLRFGARVVGLLAAAGRAVESGTLDALGGLAAIAIERAQFLEERKAAELSRQGEELKSALLASLAHDLRTPLTAIRVAADNLQASWLTERDRQEQTALVLAEVERLTRLFGNILEMARIDAGTIGKDLRWVHPAEILEAARDQVVHSLTRHQLHTGIDAARLVRVDPRLTAAALAHLLENAAQYAPAGSEIEARASVTSEGLALTVRDRGPGISPEDLPHVFERFYRGAVAKARPSGTGMGLSIARGLLAVERGRVWVENSPDGGAQFTIVVPAETKVEEAVEQRS
jgi:two-component system, OmpR family, sensor histidine kinase KdpD